jgi:RHS repeat-associated protein
VGCIASTRRHAHPEGQSNTRSNDAYAWTGHYNLNRSYTANDLNQYSAVASITPTYDSKGNLTSAGSTTYSYSSENLLTSASGGIALAYDPAMRLYQTSGGSAGTTRFGYERTHLIAEYNSSNAVLRRYVHGPGADEPVVWYEGSGTTDRRFLHTDERGSVVAVTNSSGTTLNLNGYDEYGIPSSGNVGRFQYTGQTWLPELGMYYYKARIYSPTLGRFLQTDPIGFGGGMNIYAYVGNDPINFVDPLGLQEQCGGDNEPFCDVLVVGKLFGGSGAGGGGSGNSGWGVDGSNITDNEPNVDVDGDGAPDPDIVVTAMKPSPPQIRKPGILNRIYRVFVSDVCRGQSTANRGVSGYDPYELDPRDTVITIASKIATHSEGTGKSYFSSNFRNPLRLTAAVLGAIQTNPILIARAQPRYRYTIDTGQIAGFDVRHGGDTNYITVIVQPTGDGEAELISVYPGCP